MTPTPVLPDPRNADILVHVGGELLPRDQAKISVFDSTVQGGDAVWEGLRVYNGHIFQLDAHLDRLVASAKAMAFADIPRIEEIKRAVFDTLQANGMRDGVHIRLTLSRGLKVTSGMDIRLNQYGSCLIVLAEWKAPVYNRDGIRLITSSWRRNSPQCIDSKIHHNNLINNILAKIEANAAGADDAIMLDLEGFLAETNATNLFLVRKGVLFTPRADYCLPGITRGVIIDLARERGLTCHVTRLSLSEVYAADECFTTGTMGELTPVLEVDRRTIGQGKPGHVTRQLQKWFDGLTVVQGEQLPLQDT